MSGQTTLHRWASSNVENSKGRMNKKEDQLTKINDDIIIIDDEVPSTSKNYPAFSNSFNALTDFDDVDDALLNSVLEQSIIECRRKSVQESSSKIFFTYIISHFNSPGLFTLNRIF